MVCADKPPINIRKEREFVVFVLGALEALGVVEVFEGI